MAGWRSLPTDEEWQTFDLDLTPYVRIPGQYEIEIRETDGNDLQVRRTVPVMVGNESDRLIEPLDRPFAWNINRNEKGTTGLRITLKRASKRNPQISQLVIRGPLLGSETYSR